MYNLRTLTSTLYLLICGHLLLPCHYLSPQIWNAETGAVVGKPLKGHTSGVQSVAYSPDGCHIVSGLLDKMIQIWDAKTGAAVGKPLKGHTSEVQSVTYSPDGDHIVSGSLDNTIQIWDANAGTAVGWPLEGETMSMVSAAYSPDRQRIDSVSNHDTALVSVSHLPELSPSSKLTHIHFFSQPDSGGWISDSDGGLLYWVPLDCRSGLHSTTPIILPIRFHHWAVSLDFEEFAFGTTWTEIFNSA